MLEECTSMKLQPFRLKQNYKLKLTLLVTPSVSNQESVQDMYSTECVQQV